MKYGLHLNIEFLWQNAEILQKLAYTFVYVIFFL